MSDDGYDERPPLVHTHTQHGIPRDAQQMGFDRNTEEGALIAMMGSLTSARPSHKVVAWVLLAAFSLPLLLTVWNEIF
jgi:hypothetical protein